jgi:hypothetical protein
MGKLTIPERNFTVMNKELQSLHDDFNSKKISSEVFEQKSKLLEKEIFDYKYKKKINSKELIKVASKNLSIVILFFFSGLFMITGLLLAILPLEKFSFILLGLSIVLSAITFFTTKKKAAIYLIIGSLVICVFSGIKLSLSKDVVVKDKQFEQKIKQTQKEDLKDLNELENLK